MKVIALGVNSAFAVGRPRLVSSLDGEKEILYSPKWHSNFLIEFDGQNKQGKPGEPYRFALDFGGDFRHSLAMYGLSMNQIDGFYLSHDHNDHSGGIEGIALSTFFNPGWSPEKVSYLNGRRPVDITVEGQLLPPSAKPDLFGHPEVLRELWSTARQGLNTLQGVTVASLSLETFFHPLVMTNGVPVIFQDGDRTWKIYTIESAHVVAGMELMPSYGLFFECSDGTIVYFPTDTLFMMPPTLEDFYRRAKVIYQDTETGFRSGVHSHIDDIRRVAPEIKRKLYLYHYSEEPEVEEGEFAGVLRRGDIHDY